MKTFISPEIEIEKFEIMDVVTAADGNMGGEGSEEDL